MAVDKALVLIVDDELDNADLARRTLQQRDNLSTLVAYSGAEALAILRAHSVDVLILDQRMPQMSGVELLERAQTLRRMPPAIMLTAYPEDPGVRRAQEQGLVRCIVSKPWHPDELLVTVDLVLKMKK